MKAAIKYNEILRVFIKFSLVFKNVYGLRMLRVPGNAVRGKPVSSSLIIVKFFIIYMPVEMTENLAYYSF
jgi:hypothetical protein